MEIETITLSRGAHSKREDGICAMGAVAWLAGEPHSDAPECACPILSAFIRSWNDDLPTNAERNQLLKPLLHKLIGTRSTAAVAERRSYMAFDWLIHVHTAEWLSLHADLHVHAKALRGLSPIIDLRGVREAEVLARAARDAARDAAREAARDAAVEALRPTKEKLQASALELFERMLAVR